MNSSCPFHQPNSSDRKIIFYELPRQNIFKKIFSNVSEVLSRISLKSIYNAWNINTKNDLSKILMSAWKQGSFLSKFPAPIGTVYLTGDIDVIRAVLKNFRSDDAGLFLDRENKKLFIKGLLNDIYSDDIKKLGLNKVSDMLPITAGVSWIKSLRAPLVNILSPTSVNEFLPQINIIASNIINSLSNHEKSDCNAEVLAFEFTATVISQLIMGYHTTREEYQTLARALNEFSKRMTRIVSNKSSTAIEKKEYKKAIILIKNIIDESINSASPTPFIAKLKDLNWDNFKIRVNLFLIYFAATETTASSINYLLWQLGNEKNKLYLEELRNPERGEQFISKFITEALRLHPPAFAIGRQLRCDTIFEVKNSKNETIKKMKLLRNHSILCLTQVAGLDASKYVDPNHFNPNRFENSSQPSWYPFGTGNHICPGQHLAYTELKCFISQLIKKFNIETLHPKEHIQQYGYFSLRATAAHIKFSDL